MTRVLVTGGGGFIGSGLVRGCLAAGDAVRVLDDFSTGRRANLAQVRADVEVVEGSVVDPDTVRRALAGCDVAYHLAALPSVPGSVADPLGSHAVNATGTLHVLEAARALDIHRVVLASTCAAYGETAAAREDAPPDPRSPYAAQKLASERYCAVYARLHGVGAAALRYFNVFGPRQDPAAEYAAVVPRFIAALAAGEPPTVYGDGGQTRDFVFVDDVVAATRAAAAAPDAAGEVINVASGAATTVLELAKRVAALFGREGVEPRFEPPRAGDLRRSGADVAKAARLLAWSPQVPLDTGLRRTAEFLTGAAA